MASQPQQVMKAQPSRAGADMNLMKANEIVYQDPGAASLVGQRSLHRFEAHKNSYRGGQVMEITLESGSSFLDTCSSWLRFKVTTGEAATLSNAQGSALDLIESVVVLSRSGVEIMRNDRLNVYKRATLPYERDSEYLQTTASAFWYGDVATDFAPGRFVAIPLSELSDLFCKGQQQMPPPLISGARIQITLASTKDAFKWANETVGPTRYYECDNINIYGDASEFSDAASREVMVNASQQGLKLDWTDYSHVAQASLGGALTVDFQKSVARAVRAVILTRDDANDLYAADSLGGETYDINTQRFRLGAQAFPRIPLADGDSHSAYLNNLRTFKKLQGHAVGMAAVRKADFDANSVITTLLDRSDNLQSSGISTNRSNGSLLAEITYGSVKARTLECFLIFERQVVVGLTSVLVNE
jgi:hypothetical protein